MSLRRTVRRRSPYVSTDRNSHSSAKALPKFQSLQAGIPGSQQIREAKGILREFSTPLLFHHSHHILFRADDRGRQTADKFEVNHLFVSAIFLDLGLLKTFKRTNDRCERDRGNADRQCLDHNRVSATRIQVARDPISPQTTPGIVACNRL